MRRVYISKTYAVIHEEGYEPEILECVLEEEAEVETKKEEVTKKEKTVTKKPRKCKLCGVEGHRRDNCPDNEHAGEPQADTEDEAELGEKIKEMAEKGMSTPEIAKALKVSLKVVQKYW